MPASASLCVSSNEKGHVAIGFPPSSFCGTRCGHRNGDRPRPFLPAAAMEDFLLSEQSLAPDVQSIDTVLAADVFRTKQPPIAHCRQGRLMIAVHVMHGSLWVLMRRDDQGGLALRFPVFHPAPACTVQMAEAPSEGVSEAVLIEIACHGSLGDVRFVLAGDAFGLEQVRASLDFTPKAPFALGHLPRDLCVFGKDGQAGSAHFNVEASQRKLNTALLYGTVAQPDIGKLLYVQTLTALNAYFNATGTTPEAAVAAEDGQYGYRPPLDPNTGNAILPAGRTVRLYDTILCIRAYPQGSEDDSAWQFLDMLGAIYPWLSPPETKFRDWFARAGATVHDLATAPESHIEHYGHRYFHPYTASEYPDVMVQLSLASALDEWGRWNGVRHPLVREILAGIDRFHDKSLGTLRRYLPNVGKDKNADAVDSWYLYHPMLNLANLALAGHDDARALFLATIDFGIRSAHHFKYKWPILYDIRDLSVIRAVAENDQRGQTDVGGIYAWVMLQAFELTFKRRYLDEAIAAIETAKGMRFNLNYQANLTAWGAAACIRLWRITNRKQYLAQSYVYLASFFHNSQIWESDIGLSRHWHNFMGVTCLQDAPYMAAYECFDSFAAFERYLDYGGPDLVPAVKLLVAEYCRHALDRAWFYYPDALPPEGIASNSRNGYIRRDLNFPLEDLYPDGQQAGQVGQEIYGGGAAMVFASRSFHRIDGAPGLLFCDTFVRAIHRMDGHTVSLRLDGPAYAASRLAFINDPSDNAPRPRIWMSNGQEIEWQMNDNRLEATVEADAHLFLSWNQ
ncbi:MAG: hypothetical protein IH997_08760 [Proteobacteria bacterium]|nr:hypothetical protein [Pseudomonadota bacterium]